MTTPTQERIDSIIRDLGLPPGSTLKDAAKRLVDEVAAKRSRVASPLNQLAGEAVNDTPPYSQPYGQMGWLCPRCGRGNAPFSVSCSCVQPIVTCGTGPGVHGLYDKRPATEYDLQSSAGGWG